MSTAYLLCRHGRRWLVTWHGRPPLRFGKYECSCKEAS